MNRPPPCLVTRYHNGQPCDSFTITPPTAKESWDALGIVWEATTQERAPAEPKLTHNGETRSYQEWAAMLGIHMTTIRQRVAKGWPTEQVLSSKRWGK